MYGISVLSGSFDVSKLGKLKSFIPVTTSTLLLYGELEGETLDEYEFDDDVQYFYHMHGVKERIDHENA